MKSTTRGCEFLGSRLIYWQCKKQTIMATTEAEYIAASQCYGQVLWIQNQLLDYGYNFMQTKIHVDNESAICVVKNPVYLSKTKHIEIRHHFIRDSYKKRLIEMVKIHIEINVADVLTKAFDVRRFNFLVASISSERRDLYLNDEDGTACLTVNEIFENLALMGYEIASDKLTFYKVAIATASQPPKDPNTYRRTKRGRNTKVPQSGGSPKKVGDEAINETMFDSVEKAITTDASLDAAQDSDNITKTQSTTTLNEPHPQGEGSGSGPWCQETIGGAPAQTRSERVLEQPIEPPLSEGHTSGSGEGRMEHQFELTANVPITPHDLPLPGGYTPGSDKGRLKLQELMTMCTKLSKQKDKEKVQSTSKNQEEERNTGVFESSDDDLDEEDASKQGRKNDKTNPMLHESDFDGFDDETVDAATTGVSTASAPVTTAGVAISTAEPRTPPTTTTVFDDEDVTMAMAQTLIKMKEEKAKEKGVAFKDVEDSSRPVRSITTLQPLPSIDPKDKGKETIAAQRKFRAAQRAVVCRRDPPTINLIRNLDDDFSLKNMGGYKYKEEAAEYVKEKEELVDGKCGCKIMQDLNDLYRLAQERFQDHPLEGHDLLLWGDLRMLFDPDER
ncbi:hypothetical protein Tco_0127497 [Tanacetum coccineum]